MVDGGDAQAGSEPADGLAPVIPLFGRVGESPRAPREPEPARHESRVGAGRAGKPSARSSDDRAPDARMPGARGGEAAPDVAAQVEGSNDAAEALLLRRLRTRQLSVSEAREVVVGAGMTADAAAELIERFERLGYLDDGSLADQLVHAAVERKGQGRQAIGPLLNRRGLPRDVVDAALSGLPDDDLERALEFARTKAHALGSRDRETALRRLIGQLARRGYPSSVSTAAARQALDER